MADEHCRITVVGDRRQLDLAVPAGAPITDYVDDLARLCALEESDIMPPAWSLATTLAGPFPPERSLAELGITDGQVLYLRDVLAGELEEPLVLDVAEQVAEASGQVLDRPWNAVARAATALACGVAWLVAAVLALPAPQPVGVPAVGGLAVVLGVLLPLLAWVAGERRWPLPAPLRLVVALSSIPALAVAGWALVSAQWSDTLTSGAHPTMTGTELVTASAAAGVLIGALLAYVAASGVTTLAVLTAALVGAVTVGILTALKADSVQSAALVAVVAFLLLTAAPATAGRIVASAFRHGGLPSGAADEGRDQVRAAVRTAMVLLAVWGVLLALVLGSSLVILGSAPNVYGNAIAGCLGVALLLRAGSAKVVVEVVPGAVAGMAGLFTLLLIGPGHLGWPGVTVPLALVVVGVCLLGYGLRRLMRRDLPALRRPGWFGTLGAVLGAMSIPLILAGFGVFGTLMGMGEHL